MTNILKEIAKNSFADNNFHHNQAIDVIDFAIKNNYFDVTQSPILINLDAHSDIYVNTENVDLTRGNWINYLISKYNFREIYWVIPTYISKNCSYFKQKQNLDNYCLTRSDEPIDISDKSIQILYYDFQANTLHTKGKIDYVNDNCIKFGLDKIFNINKYKKVILHRVPINKLPDFKNKNVFLTIDGDYYSNCGYQTIENRCIHNRNEELKRMFLTDITTLIQKNITPKLISMCISPQFCYGDNLPVLESLFIEIVRNSNRDRNTVIHYKHYSSQL